MIQIQIWPRKYKQWIRKFKSVIKCEAQIQSNTNSPCSQLCTEYNLHSMKREQTRCTSKSSQNTKYGAAFKSKVTCSVGFCPMWAKKARSRFTLLLWIKAERVGMGGGTVVDLEQKDPGWPPQPCKSTDRVGKLQMKIYLNVNRIKIKQTRPFKIEV